MNNLFPIPASPSLYRIRVHSTDAYLDSPASIYAAATSEAQAIELARAAMETDDEFGFAWSYVYAAATIRDRRNVPRCDRERNRALILRHFQRN
jgi:hypothetical protein